jgi:hypothetical protein
MTLMPDSRCNHPALAARRSGNGRWKVVNGRASSWLFSYGRMGDERALTVNGTHAVWESKGHQVSCFAGKSTCCTVPVNDVRVFLFHHNVCVFFDRWSAFGFIVCSWSRGGREGEGDR